MSRKAISDATNVRKSMVAAVGLVGNITGASRKWKSQAKRDAVDCSRGITKFTIPSGGKVSFMPNGSAEWVDLGECGPVNVTVEHESIESAAQFRVDVANVSASMGKQS